MKHLVSTEETRKHAEHLRELPERAPSAAQKERRQHVSATALWGGYGHAFAYRPGVLRGVCGRDELAAARWCRLSNRAVSHAHGCPHLGGSVRRGPRVDRPH